jgi:indole-3-glycerol phosphate synthase
MLERRARETAPPPTLRLSDQRFDLIAELKLRSPALGTLRARESQDVAARVADYARAGAVAVSVLTEPSRFDGELAHLEAAARALAPLAVPAMRKDFLVDPYQVWEARAAGAGGVLVILRMLSRGEVEALLDAARAANLFVLLEAFDQEDLALARELVGTRHPVGALHGPKAPWLVGVNSRDLATLEVVPGRLEALAAQLPPGVPSVAESGLESAADAARVATAGYSVALVGGALMKREDPQALVREMLAAGRAAGRLG